MRPGPALLAAVLAAIGVSLAWAPAALATHVSCGDTITTDTALDSDLIDCPGDGVVIGADNITLDLKGHTIDGSGNGDGVDNSAGHAGVTVDRGVIRQFVFGVFVSGNANSVNRLIVSESGSTGISLRDADGNRVSRNVLLGSTSSSFGIVLSGDSDDNEIDRNEVVNPVFAPGIILTGGPFFIKSDRNLVSRNSITGGGVAIGVIAGDDNVLEGNSVSHPSTYGISVRIEPGFNTVIDRNRIIGAGLVGIEATQSRLVTRNEVRDSGENGIRLTGSGSTLVEKNVSSNNGEDGIDVSGSLSIVVRENTANDNADLGIAASGVTDGGGNKASGNGNPLQCVGVVCK
jgi:parallel beta-helix repeat protein